MTDREESTLGSYAEELAELRKTAARLARLEESAKGQTVRALKAGLAENVVGARSEVAQASPFSAPTVRALADAAGIAPDARYVRGTKSAPAPGAAAARREPARHFEAFEIPPEVGALSPSAARRLAERAASIEDGWAERVLAERPGVTEAQRPYTLVAVALVEGLLAQADLAA